MCVHQSAPHTILKASSNFNQTWLAYGFQHGNGHCRGKIPPEPTGVGVEICVEFSVMNKNTPATSKTNFSPFKIGVELKKEMILKSTYIKKVQNDQYWCRFHRFGYRVE